MYTLVYLPMARKDIVEIISYIHHHLLNPMAAQKLSEEMEDAADRLLMFPYAHPLVEGEKPSGRVYRKLHVRNYIMFYWVDEVEKLVTIARVLYARRDYGRSLD